MSDAAFVLPCQLVIPLNRTDLGNCVAEISLVQFPVMCRKYHRHQASLSFGSYNLLLPLPQSFLGLRYGSFVVDVFSCNWEPLDQLYPVSCTTVYLPQKEVSPTKS